MPHFVIKCIQDETYKKGEVMIFFRKHESVLRALKANIFKKASQSPYNVTIPFALHVYDN